MFSLIGFVFATIFGAIGLVISSLAFVFVLGLFFFLALPLLIVFGIFRLAFGVVHIALGVILVGLGLALLI